MSESLRMPWQPGAATGVGSYPGDDPAEALRIVLGELPDLPHLPELPDRGPGADMIGRTAAMLVELPVELAPSGWRLADHPGRDLRRSHSLLARDLDALEELAGGYAGPLKLQAAGPWTLAAAVELPYGDKVLADLGAVRDLTDSLAEGLAAHVAEVRRRVPGAAVVLQLDEPSLPGVLAGTVPTASGFGRLHAVEEDIVRSRLAGALAVPDAFPMVHCCALRPPIEALRRAGARALSLDAGALTGRDDEALAEAVAEAVEAGYGLALGVVPGTDAELAAATETASSVRALWRRLGFPAERLPAAVVLTPACGLAGASPAYARAALGHCRDAARILAEDPEG